MKKMFKAAALLAAAMMVMGFVSCSDSDDSNDTVLPAQESGGEASSGGSDEKSDDGAKSVTADFFDLQNPSSAITAIKGTDAGKTQSLSADVKESGASGNLNLVLSAAGTGKGETLSSSDGKNVPMYKYAVDKGLTIKRDALKIEGIKGKVKATVAWAWYKANGAANDRKLEVTVGNGDVVCTSVTATTDTAESKIMLPYTVSFDGGEEGTALYIGASNEINILSIKIEAQ